LLAGLHFHQLLLHNLIFFQEKERGIYIQSTSNSEAGPKAKTQESDNTQVHSRPSSKMQQDNFFFFR
jgi:hypothetical protein